MHYNDVIMSASASQITNLTIVYSTTYSRRRSKKASRLRVTDFCAGYSPVTGEINPRTKACNAENVSIWWRHHGSFVTCRVHPSNIADGSFSRFFVCFDLLKYWLKLPMYFAGLLRWYWGNQWSNLQEYGQMITDNIATKISQQYRVYISWGTLHSINDGHSDDSCHLPQPSH